MESVKRILFPVELAPISNRIAPFVRYQAQQFGADLHVVHVLADPVQYAAIYYLDPHQIKGLDTLMDEAQDRLEAFCKENYLAAKIAVLAGDTVESILEYAAQNKINQIIMGTHGRKGLERIVLGSVALRLIRRSPIPVLIINPELMDRQSRAEAA